MKLRCTDHSQRVMVLNRTTVHRHDGSLCVSPTLRIGTRLMTPVTVREYGYSPLDGHPSVMTGE
jgi:hypothetical protein